MKCLRRIQRSLGILMTLITGTALLAGCSAFQPAPMAAPTATETPISTPSLTLTPSPTAALTSTATPMAAATTTPIATATLTATATPSAIPTATAAPTLTPTAVPTTTSAVTVAAAQTMITPITPGDPWPTPDVSLANDHYWLGRPTGPGTIQWASPFYPYGSTGQGAYLLHHGVDIANPIGTPLLAPADGVVVFAGSDSRVAIGPTTKFYGNAVVIELDRHWNDQSVFVLLGHMNNVVLQVGQHVARGQRVGEVGNTGIALGPHVHVEVRVGQNDYDHTRNAEFWLEPLPGNGVLAGRVLTSDGLHLPNVALLLHKGQGSNSQRFYTYTYEDALGSILPDDQWGENFLLADLPAGRYRVEVSINGRTYKREVMIQEGRTTWMELRTDLAYNDLIE